MDKQEEKYTEGSIISSIWRLGWPAVTSMLLHTLMTLTDTIWVGRLGPTEMAAVQSSIFTIWTVFSMLMIISTGVVAIISRAVGAGQTDEIGRIGRQSILFSIYVAIGYSIFGYIIAPHVFNFMDTETAVSQLGISYLRIFFIGVLFFFINDSISAIFRAIGDTRAPLYATTTAVLINIVLDPILIFGWLGIPALGTKGAAIATVVSAFCGTLLYLNMIRRGRLKYCLNFRLFEKLDFGLAKAIIKIGSPPATAGMVFSVIYIFLNKIAAQFGTISIAALTVGNRMESLSYLICFGFSIAATTMVGQNLGAGKPYRAAKSAWMSVAICAGWTLFISILFLIFPDLLSRIFTSDEKVIAIAINYLRILALSQIFMAAEIVLEGAFAGAGNTVPPMVISIPGTVIRLPMAYYLCFETGLGIDGLWWTLTITTWIKALIMMYWFYLGRWKKTGIIKT
ncbi:MAG: MATE family efflux transporter [Candidatus Zixiibacteriota bacterium]